MSQMKARRRARALEAAPFKVHRLNKDGKPSRAHDALYGFASEEAAQEYVAGVRNLNAPRVLRFAINGVEV